MPQRVEMMPPVDPSGQGRVIISRSVKMEDTEVVLWRGMVAIIIGTRPGVSADEVANVLYATFELQLGDFSIHHTNQRTS